MWSEPQRAEFDEHGLTRLPGAVDPAEAAALVERIWSDLERTTGVDRDTRVSHRFERPKAAATKALQRSGAFDLVGCEVVRSSADGLLGRGRWASQSGPQLLLSLPGDAEWRVPHDVWHLDYRAPGGRPGLPGLQVFLCLDRVAPRGGGTLAVAGSHRLVARIQRAAAPSFAGRSAELRKRLRRDVPWLADLFARRPDDDPGTRFLDPGAHEGVPLQVVELTGEPGDAIVMHPWLLHSLSSNRADRARMVLTDRLRSRDHPF